MLILVLLATLFSQRCNNKLVITMLPNSKYHNMHIRVHALIIIVLQIFEIEMQEKVTGRNHGTLLKVLAVQHSCLT